MKTDEEIINAMILQDEQCSIREEMLQEAYNERNKTFPKWDDIRLELEKADLREIIDLLILEPRAFDDLSKYIKDTYDCYEDDL